MSQFLCIKTQIMDEVCLKQAIIDNGFKIKDNIIVCSYDGEKEKVDVGLDIKSKYGVGFKKTADGYSVVADWWGIRQENHTPVLEKDKFINSVNQRYAYRKTVQTLNDQGFTLANEEVNEADEIVLTVRQWA